MSRAAAVMLAAVVLAGCAAEPAAQPETAPAPPTSLSPAVEPATEAAIEPVLAPVELAATLSAEGDTVTVLGRSNLPDGAVVVWELAETIEAFAADPESILRDADGRVPTGRATVVAGAFGFEVSQQGWGALDLCSSIPLQLFLLYMPWADFDSFDSVPEQPGSIYDLHGAGGELLPGAVPPAELRKNGLGMGLIATELTCP